MYRVRAKIRGTEARPRLALFRSNRYTWVQLIDDQKGHTLVSSSTKDVKSQNVKTKIAQAAALGKEIAKRAAEKGITQAVLDRRQYHYHGRIKAFTEAVREGGLTL